MLQVPGSRPARGLETDAVAIVLLEDGREIPIPIGDAELVGPSLVLAGEAERFIAQVTWRRAADGPWHDVDLTIRHRNAMPVLAAVRVRLTLAGDGGRPHWLIPGCFCGENRPPGVRRRFPRWDPSPEASRGADSADPADNAVDDRGDDLVSDSWSF